MTDLAIRVENLSKLYHIGRAQQRHDTLRDALVSTFKRSNVPTFKRSNVQTAENPLPHHRAHQRPGRDLS